MTSRTPTIRALRVLQLGALLTLAMAACSTPNKCDAPGQPSCSSLGGGGAGGGDRGPDPAVAGRGGAGRGGAGGSQGGAGESGRGGSSEADGPVPALDGPNGGEGECPENQHFCAGLGCVPNTAIEHCGSSCQSPCGAPTGGEAACDGTKCTGKCPSGSRLCFGACVPDGQACGGSCPPGTNDCSGLCVPPTDVNACGSKCERCTAPTGATATCDGTACAFICNTGKACGTKCGECCEATDCPAKPGFTATCDAGTLKCRYGCPSGQKACGDRCIPDAACCADSDCPPKDGQVGKCDTSSGQCQWMCAGNTKPCAGKCIASGSCCGPNGQEGCPQNQACASGQCIQCRSSGACSTNPCKDSSYQCSNAQESCQETNKTDGTACGSGRACRNGACVQCRSSGTCSTNPCKNSTFQCNNGQETCQESDKPPNTSCGNGRVCRGGTCTELADRGDACSAPTDCKSGNCTSSRCCNAGEKFCDGQCRATSYCCDGTQCNISNGRGACSGGSCQRQSCNTGFDPDSNNGCVRSCGPRDGQCPAGCSFEDYDCKKPNNESCNANLECRDGNCARNTRCCPPGQDFIDGACRVPCQNGVKRCKDFKTVEECVNGKFETRDCRDADGGPRSVCGPYGDRCDQYGCLTPYRVNVLCCETINCNPGDTGTSCVFASDVGRKECRINQGQACFTTPGGANSCVPGNFCTDNGDGQKCNPP